MNGIAAIQYEADITNPDNRRFTGILWEAKQELPLPLKWEDPANNLVVTWEKIMYTTFPATLFQPPSDYMLVGSPRIASKQSGLHDNQEK